MSSYGELHGLFNVNYLVWQVNILQLLIINKRQKTCAQPAHHPHGVRPCTCPHSRIPTVTLRSRGCNRLWLEWSAACNKSWEVSRLPVGSYQRALTVNDSAVDPVESIPSSHAISVVSSFLKRSK